MTAEETARARHRLYALLGRLLVEGPSRQALAVVRAVPSLAELADEDPEELAAGHHAVTTEVPPALSAVLGEDGLVGGPLADLVRERYRAAGFHPGRHDVPPDHVGLLLACAGHLCAAEAEAHENGLDAGHVHALQRSLLDEQILSWLPAWVLAVRDADEPFWTVVAELALELCASHRAELRGGRHAVRPTGALPDLDDERTDLLAIGSLLVRPSASGWLPGRRALVRACAAAGVPAGYGERGRLLGDALRAAADLRRLPVLLDALVGELDRFTAELRALGAELPTERWLERAAHTRALLERLHAAAVDPPEPTR